MSDTTAVLAGHTKKYNIPLTHFEYKYIQSCTDGKELERIYKELIGGELGSFKDLENLTLDRLRDVKPNSQLLRQDKSPLDKSALPEVEREGFDDFLKRMQNTSKTSSNNANDHSNNGLDFHPIRNKSIVTSSITPTPSKSVISNNGKPKRIVPRSYAEWGKLDQKLSREMNSDNEEEDDDNEDEDPKPPIKPRVLDQIPEKSQRLQMAEQHRLTGNTAFKANKYQQSIDSYTNSILLDKTNPVVYMNRALAYFKLNDYDASLADCSEVLTKDPRHIKALYRRASCYIAKQQYDQAKDDLDSLLTVEPENSDAKALMTTIPTTSKTKSVRIPITEDDGEDEAVPQPPAPSEPVKIPILEVDEEEEDVEEEPQPEPVPESEQQLSNGSNQTINIDIPKPITHNRPCIDSQEASPAMFDSHLHQRDDMNQFHQNMNSQLSSLPTRTNHDDDDDDDEMDLGDEASGFIGHMSDDDGNHPHSMNVSPTSEDDDNNSAPELVDHKPLRTPPITPITKSMRTDNSIDYQTGHRFMGNYNQQNFSSIETENSYDRLSIPTVSNNYSSMHSNTFEQRSSTINSTYEHITNSNFSSTLQSWLRDLVEQQSNNRSSSYSTRVWSRAMRPYALDRLQRDIERFHRLNDLRNAVEASKKMLKNGVLDYHKHAEYIVGTLMMCVQCYSKANDYPHTIQYATEALLYDRTDSSALLYRAKAFENHECLILSYADYARIPSADPNHRQAQQACEKLAIELKTKEGSKWSEKLPKDTNDDDRYLEYIKLKDKFAEADPLVWYRSRGNQLYLDGCFVLAIRCFTYCIEIKPDIATPYTNRAACYLRVFEPGKALADCTIALKLDSNNVRALYRKACAFKMLSNDDSYRSTLEELLKIQPNNQNVLAEYFSSQNEPIPRKMRRLRPTTSVPTTSTSPTTSLPSVQSATSSSTNIFEDILLSYEELEEIRTKKLSPFTVHNKYQFTQQLNTLKSQDIKTACSLILRLPDKGLFKIITGASTKLIETMVKACRTMIYAQKRYQQEHKSTILPFSYVNFAFNLLCELTTLPRLDSTISMIDQTSRAALDDILTYFSSISSILTGIDKLDRLRK